MQGQGHSDAGHGWQVCPLFSSITCHSPNSTPSPNPHMFLIDAEFWLAGALAAVHKPVSVDVSVIAWNFCTASLSDCNCIFLAVLYCASSSLLQPFGLILGFQTVCRAITAMQQMPSWCDARQVTCDALRCTRTRSAAQPSVLRSVCAGPQRRQGAAVPEARRDLGVQLQDRGLGRQRQAVRQARGRACHPGLRRARTLAKIPTLPHPRRSTPSPYNLTTAHSPGCDLLRPSRLFAHAHVILHMVCVLALCWAWHGRVACRLVMDAC